MNFLSLKFFIFVLITFILFYVVRLIKIKGKQIIPQWAILFVASLVFYGFTNVIYLIYILGSAAVTYVTSILVQYKFCDFLCASNIINSAISVDPRSVKSHDDRRFYENLITFIAIAINVGVLIVLKYYNFFAETVNGVFSTNFTIYNFIIPLGISFYTFSLISYSVDCCQRKTKVELNPFKFILFVSYFPKVLQGPISSYDQLKQDGLFSGCSFKDNNYLKPIFRICIGIIKKVFIADIIGLYVNGIFANVGTTSSLLLILGSLLYTIQLYCDFSGFMDMALGISGLFGIKLEENFNTPYLSSSVSEFWRRWHITLGAWLRKYIYIPLGGNRVNKFRYIINIFIVWLVSGLWHGANWTFIIWGLFHGLCVTIEGLLQKYKKSQKLEPPPYSFASFKNCYNIFPC